MRKSVWIGLMFVLLIASPSLAQDEEKVKGSFDVRAAWVGRNQAQNNTIDDPVYYDLGFRVSRYIGDFQRFSFRFSFDYLGTGGRPALSVREERTVEVSLEQPPFKETLVGYPRIHELGYMPNFGLEMDLVRIPHVNLAVHAGVGSLIVSRSIVISGHSLCDNPEYSSGCGVKSELLGNVGMSLRFTGHKWRKDNFIGGVDYTLFTRKTKQIAIFAGITF